MLHRNVNIFSSKAGYSLTSIILGMALFTILGIASSTIIFDMLKTVKIAMAAETRNQLSYLIESVTRDYSLMISSAKLIATNTALNDCLINPSAKKDACPTVDTDVEILDPTSPSLIDVFQPNVQLTGTKANPKRFKLDGEPCNAASAVCPFESYSSFRAICRDKSLSSCVRAEQIIISYSFEVASGVDLGFPFRPIKANSIMSWPGANGVDNLHCPESIPDLAPNEARIRFNPAKNSLQYCDGESWKNISYGVNTDPTVCKNKVNTGLVNNITIPPGCTVIAMDYKSKQTSDDNIGSFGVTYCCP